MTLKWPKARAAAGTGRLFPVLGIAVIAISLLSGFAQAAEAASGAAPDNCGSATIGCYAEVKINGYWYTQYVGNTVTDCHIYHKGERCTSHSTIEDCHNTFPGYDIVATDYVTGCY